jgi:hypothetical protein
VSEQNTDAPKGRQRLVAHDATVVAKPAMPEQNRAEQQATLKLKEQTDGPGNSSPL